MIEDLLKIRVAAYLKMVQSDIWAVPPNILSVAKSWFISAYAASVAALAQAEYVKLTQSIGEAAKLADDLNTLLLNLHQILASMEPNEIKEIPINANVFKHWTVYDKVSIVLTRTESNLFDLKIATGTQKEPGEVRGQSANSIITILDQFISALLDRIDNHDTDQEIAEVKMLLNLANKLNTQNLDLANRDSIGKTIDIDLTGWPYLDSIKNAHIKFLSSILDSNAKTITQIIEASSNLKNAGDKIGPFFLKNGRGVIYSTELSINEKGSLDIKTESGSSKHKVVLNDKSKLKNLLDMHFINPISGFLRAAQVGDFNTYLQTMTPQYSKINMLYQNRPAKIGGEDTGILGSWSQHTFTLMVRPSFVNPILQAEQNGTNPITIFTAGIESMQDTIRHELQHFAQNLSTLLSTGKSSFEFGLPSKQDSPFKDSPYQPTGEAKKQDKDLSPQEYIEKHQFEGKELETKMLKHELRDVEYQTRLADEISVFKRITKLLPKKLLPRAIRIWVGNINEDLFPFASGTSWEAYKREKDVDDQYILQFFKDYQVNFPNLENAVKNKLNPDDSKNIVNRAKYIEEIKLLRATNSLVKSSSFFTALKEVASKEDNLKSSRWANAISSFVKEVS